MPCTLPAIVAVLDTEPACAPESSEYGPTALRDNLDALVDAWPEKMAFPTCQDVAEVSRIKR